MAAASSFEFPPDLESDDGYGSDEYSWSDEDDTQSIVDNMSSMRMNGRGKSGSGRRGQSRSTSNSGSYNGSQGRLCVICYRRPRHTTYTTCGLTCSALLKKQTQDTGTPRPDKVKCVVCKENPTHRDYPTCGLTCAAKLCKDGAGDPTMCDYCHRDAVVAGTKQCAKCVEYAKVACLLFEQKFQSGWKAPAQAAPPITKIFKIIESDEFLRPYHEYQTKVKNQHFRYHGTTRSCGLGVSTTELCSSTGCSLCSILKTSFKVDIAKPSGAFGQGVYSSSAANKAYNYVKTGGLLLTKVALGRVKEVTKFEEVKALPDGYDSVNFERFNGILNETVVYSDDAIRPVFLIMF